MNILLFGHKNLEAGSLLYREYADDLLGKECAGKGQVPNSRACCVL